MRTGVAESRTAAPARRRDCGIAGQAAPSAIRLVPFPYRAMLAVCSDLDETPDRAVYEAIARFLNTTATTAMGPGAGLEVGNTIYFDMPAEQFSYWNTDDAGRALVHALIESGHVDCLHSYGDFATHREHAARALDALSRLRRPLEVWIDHAVAPSNFGADIMRGTGDTPGSPVYHADLTCDYGVKYVWRGRITSVIGQDVPRRLGGIFDVRHPLAAAKTLSKEAAKGILAQRGSVKYAMHAANEVMRCATLRDGRGIFEFMRCNPFWGGVQHAATAAGVPQALTPRALDLLVERGGICIFYTHLGKIADLQRPFGASTCEAFRRLAEYERRGKILVTTTRRLLGYCRARRELHASVESVEPGEIRIAFRGIAPASLAPSDLDGLTLYVERPEAVRVTIDGRPIADWRCNPPDETGRASVSLPWPRLEFPEL